MGFNKALITKDTLQHHLVICFSKRGLSQPVCAQTSAEKCIGATRALMSITSPTESALNYISEIWTNPARYCSWLSGFWYLPTKFKMGPGLGFFYTLWGLHKCVGCISKGVTIRKKIEQNKGYSIVKIAVILS